MCRMIGELREVAAIDVDDEYGCAACAVTAGGAEGKPAAVR